MQKINSNKSNSISKIKKHFFLFPFFFFLFVTVSCSFDFAQLKQLFSNEESQEEKTEQPEQITGQSQQQDPEDSVKTYLDIYNNSQFTINVFLQTPSNLPPWATLKAGTSLKKEITPSASMEGDVIYIQYIYEIKISDTQMFSFPHYDSSDDSIKDCVKTKHLEKGKVNTINIPKLTSVKVNKSYLILQNESDSDIILYDKASSPIIPLEENYWVNSGEYKVYELTNSTAFSNFVIMADFIKTPIELSMDSISPGYIYALIYKDSKAELVKVLPIDISVQEKMWKLPVNQEFGKFITIEKISPRENPEDGYFITGQLSYDSDSKKKESKPYNVKITTDGFVEDKLPCFINTPIKMSGNVFAEKNGKLIVAGIEAFSSSSPCLYFYGEGDCDFYLIENISAKTENDVANISTKKLIFKTEDGNADTFALLYNTKAGFGIYELTVYDDGSVNGKIVYENTQNIFAQDFLYSKDEQEYVILCQEDFDDDGQCDQSCVLFVNDDLTETKESLQNYFFNTLITNIFLSDSNYVIACGSYKNAKTGNYEASFVSINLQQKKIDSKYFLDRKLFSFSPSKEYLNSCFECAAINGSELLLAGKTDYNNDDVSSGYPYLVSIDLTSENIRYIVTYSEKNYEGFEIFSCNFSAIETPFIALRNAAGETYIASCDYLGKIPEGNMLAPLPRSCDIYEIAAPVEEIPEIIESESIEIEPTSTCEEPVEEVIEEIVIEPIIEEPVYSGPKDVVFTLCTPWVTSKRGGILKTGHKHYTVHEVLTIISENDEVNFSHYEIHYNNKSYTTTQKTYNIDIYMDRTNHGSFEVTVYAVDIFGNKSNAASKTFTF